MVLRHPSRNTISTPQITSSRISAQQTTHHSLCGELGGRGTTTSLTTMRVANKQRPSKSVCAGDAVLHTRQRTASHSAHFYKRLTLLKSHTQMAAHHPEHTHTTDSPATATFPSHTCVCVTGIRLRVCSECMQVHGRHVYFLYRGGRVHLPIVGNSPQTCLFTHWQHVRTLCVCST